MFVENEINEMSSYLQSVLRNAYFSYWAQQLALQGDEQKVTFLQPRKGLREIRDVIALASNPSTNIHHQPSLRVLLQRSPGCILGMGVFAAQGEKLFLRGLGLFIIVIFFF